MITYIQSNQAMSQGSFGRQNKVRDILVGKKDKLDLKYENTVSKEQSPLVSSNEFL